MEKVLIITGGSRGIGQALVTEYLRNGFYVWSIARSQTAVDNPALVQIPFDLSSTSGFELLFEEIFAKISGANVREITFINNAAALTFGPIDTVPTEDIQRVIQLNLTAPFLLTSLFIRHTTGWRGRKKMINISSGAAAKPYYGWSVYCATKAALDMLTRTVAVEQAAVENGVRVISISPGVVDTDMQTAVRSVTKATFRDVDRFRDLKSKGALTEPGVAANRIFAIDSDDNIENGAIIDLRTHFTGKI